MTGGGTDNGSTKAPSSTGNTGPLMLPELERQKISGGRLEETRKENGALSNTERPLYQAAAPMGRAATVVSGIDETEENYDCAIETSKQRYA
ncbi:hypothetical protein HPB52_009563 [Rhipicephalus sanguineus]|uniref:Uncharacterized protein n=1 Tax=Rhipicephalus sanguineus TaxID=34632 RepID=A0A9D4PI21_RHISA|nr:hypothetical protein HPB52_009563 [Rhipicephalus sanguineus]